MRGGRVHVVWDWNGTLYDDHRAVLAAVNAILLTERCGAVDSAAYRAAFQVPLRGMYEGWFGRAIPPGEWDDLCERWRQCYNEALPTVGLADDALAALDHVATRGAGQSLLSMHLHDRITQHLVEFRIADRFSLVDGARRWEDASKASRLVRHLRALGDPPAAEVLVVGDTLDDALAAKAVGATIVLYDGGTHAVDDLVASGHPVAHSLLEALELGGL